MAHKNQSQLEVLINSLINDFDLFVHIDKKSNIKIKELESKFSQVSFFCEYDVRWGGHNQIKCPLYLFEKAYNPKYKFYILISGQDLPIKTNKEIKDFLYKENSSFVVSDQLPISQWKFNGGVDRVGLFWESDIVGNSIFDKIKRKIIGNLRKHQRERNIRRPFYKNMNLYGGSNWVILKQDVMSFLLEFVNQNPKYIRRFKHCYCADELWIQTILATSDYNIINDHFTYLDWGKGPEYPRTLRIDDYEDITNSKYLFARKFDSEIDKTIIDKIEIYRENKNAEI